MAFWKRENEDIEDENRKDGHGRMVSYGADTQNDIHSLPRFDGQNQGSSCLVLGDKSYWVLGTDPAAGINGWVNI
jgi:hypothetical protein